MFKNNMDLVRQRRAQIQKNNEDREQGAHFDKLVDSKTGPNTRRICPPWSAEGAWRKYAGYHYNVVQNKVIVCLKRTFNKPCPICEEVDRLYKTKNEEDRVIAGEWRARDRFFCNVLNLDKKDNKVYVLAFGQQLEEGIVNIMDGGAAEGGETFGAGDITDPKTGRNVRITKTVPQDKRQTSYAVVASGTPSEVPGWEQIEQQMHDLDALVQKDVYSYDDIMKMLAGEVVNKAAAAQPERQETAAQQPKADPKPSQPAAGAVTDEFETPASKAAAKNAASGPVDEFASPAAQNTTQPAGQAPAAGGKPPSALDRLRSMKAQQQK